MGFMFNKSNSFAKGTRLTGFPRYTEVLGGNFKKLFLTSLMTLLGFIPFAAGTIYAILSQSILVLIPSCIVAGIFIGPALSCMYDCVLRGLRDAPGKFWENYKRALKQNWRQAILPGIFFSLMLGLYIFMAMLFWWSTSFPGWGTIVLYFFSLFIFTMFFSLCWPQIALFNQSFRQCAKNSLLLMLRYFWKVAGTALLQIIYWIIMVLFLPWSIILVPILGFWFIIYTAVFLMYDTLNDVFKIEEQIAQSFPDQVPVYEDDEAWLKRKQEERHDTDNTNS